MGALARYRPNSPDLSLYVQLPRRAIFPDRFKIGPAEFSDRIRWFGILLEVLAILTIARGLANSFAAFDKPKPIRRFFLWIADFRYVFVHRSPIHASVHMKAGAATIGVAGGVAAMTGGALEDRVGYLERSVKAMEENVAKVTAEAKRIVRELHEALETEAKERRLGDEAVNRKLEDQTIGDANLQVAGLALLLISIVMANAPTEASLFLQYLGLDRAGWW
jgi:hypothetical protein